MQFGMVSILVTGGAAPLHPRMEVLSYLTVKYLIIRVGAEKPRKLLILTVRCNVTCRHVVIIPTVLSTGGTASNCGKNLLKNL